jgi:DNA repair exonuclease SbcCD ATPase subunit
VHAREESADSRAASLGLLEAGLATREEEACHRELELRQQEEQLSTLEDRLNSEREALETRKNMGSQTATALAQRQEELLQRESTLQERMDHMLNQRRVSLEQETERRRAEILEAHRTDFRSKTDATLEHFNQKRDTLERQVGNLEAELKRANESRRGAEQALKKASSTLDELHRELTRIELENEAMVQ